MKEKTAVMALDQSRAAPAVDTLYQCYNNYPLFNHYFPDPEKKKKHLSWHLRQALVYARRFGETWCTPEATGVACWLPPGNTEFTTPKALLGGYALVPFRYGLKDFARIDAQESFVSKLHKKLMPGRHLYLWVLAVRPEYQGKGIGRRLVESRLAAPDAREIPCFLETHDRRNVPFYKALGFVLLEEAPVPDSDLRVYAMARRAG